MWIVSVPDWCPARSLVIAMILVVSAPPCLGDEVVRKVPPGFRSVFEYSLELHTLNLKEDKSQRREGKNPFTGERMIFIAFEGMRTSELNALVKILDEKEATVSDDEGSRSLTLPNGTLFSIRGLGRRPKSGIQALQVDIITRTKFSEPEAILLRQLALAGNLAICSSTDCGLVATFAPVASKEFKNRYEKAKVLATPGELVRWMQKEIGGRPAIDPVNFERE